MTVLETLTFRTAPGVAEPEFLAADTRVQARFFNTRAGCVRRTTARASGEDGAWIVVTMWEAPGDADTAAAEEAAHPAAVAFTELVDPSSVRRGRYVTLD